MKLHHSLFPWRSFSHLTQNAPTLLSLFSFKHVWCVPVLTTVLQLHATAAAIMSCRAASLFCCCARGVGGHLGRDAELWVQLSKTQSTLPHFDQNIDGRGRGKRSPCTSAPNRQSARCQHFNYLFTPISPSQLKCPHCSDSKGSTAGRSQGQERKKVCVSCAASSLLHLLDRTVRSSCAGSCSGRCVGRTGPRSHTRRSRCSLARIGSHCSLMQTHINNVEIIYLFWKLVIKQQVVFLLHLLSCMTDSRDLIWFISAL